MGAAERDLGSPAQHSGERGRERCETTPISCPSIDGLSRVVNEHGPLTDQWGHTLRHRIVRRRDVAENRLPPIRVLLRPAKPPPRPESGR